MKCSCFLAVTEENIQDFLQRLCSIHQDVISIGKSTFKAAIVEAFNRSGDTNRGQPTTCTTVVEDLLCNWKGRVLSCLQLNWRNIHSLNTENSEFFKETLPMAIAVYGATHDPLYTISDAISEHFLTRIHQLNNIYEHISTAEMKLRSSYKSLSQEQKEHGCHDKYYHYA